MINNYLAALAAQLRVSPWRRRRILAEVEAHLLDDGGDQEAMERFGTTEEVAARFNELAPRPHPRLAALFVLFGIVTVFGFVQGLERHIPPAPWPEGKAPAGLETLFTLATVCYLAAIVLAVGALLIRRAAVALARAALSGSPCFCSPCTRSAAPTWWPARLPCGSSCS